MWRLLVSPQDLITIMNMETIFCQGFWILCFICPVILLFIEIVSIRWSFCIPFSWWILKFIFLFLLSVPFSFIPSLNLFGFFCTVSADLFISFFYTFFSLTLYFSSFIPLLQELQNFFRFHLFFCFLNIGLLTWFIFPFLHPLPSCMIKNGLYLLNRYFSHSLNYMFTYCFYLSNFSFFFHLYFSSGFIYVSFIVAFSFKVHFFHFSYFIRMFADIHSKEENVMWQYYRENTEKEANGISYKRASNQNRTFCLKEII